MRPAIAAVMLWAGLLGLLFLVLSVLVGRQRRRAGIGIGHGGDAQLERAIRVHGNFAEYTPIVLVLLLLLALSGWGSLYIHILAAIYFAARIAHAVGLWQSSGVTPGRAIGLVGTWGVLAVASVLAVATAIR
jgi:uncharacterized membrane protein YecN with MAPEG domain